MQVQQGQQAPISGRVALVGKARRTKDHDRLVVRVEWGVPRERPQSRRPSDQTPKELKIVHQRQRLQLLTQSLVTYPLLKPTGGISGRFERAHQSKHRRIDIEPQKIRATVREHLQESPDDDTKHRFVQLKERQPLAKKSVRRQS